MPDLPYQSPITFLCHPYHRGGVTRWMVDMAAECVDRGLDVYFVTVQPKVPFLSAGGRETMVSLVEAVRGVKLISRTVNWDFEFGTESYRANIYAQLLKAYIPESSVVVLSDDPSVWKTSSIAGSKFSFIGVLHADEEHYYELARRYKSDVEIFTSVSKRITSQLLSKEPGISTSRIVTIPCGIPLPALGRERHNDALLRLIYVGRITQYQKRVFDLAALCKLLTEQGIQFKLEIIGSGGDQEHLKELIEGHGNKENVSFLGWKSKEEIFERLEVSDVLLLTSDFEGMPIAVMEALSMGCGVVSTRVSGVEDYEDLPQAQNSLWLFDVGDIENAVDKIVFASKVSKDVRRSNARKFAESEFSIQQCFEKYNAAINAKQPSVVSGTREVYLPLSDKIKSYTLSYLRFLKARYFLSGK